MRYKNNVPVVFCGNGYIYIVASRLLGVRL